MDRTILHCDCNAFYASVECVKRPELKSVPMAVGGDTESRHGIIYAKNDLAKRYGIRTAETVWQAKRKCPHLVIVPPHREEYQIYSDRINQIYQEYTDLVEPFSIDESWLDVTQSRRLFGDGKTIADTLRKRINQELGITISVGVSFNKIFAKMGSDYRKPDATTVIDRENYQQILYPLSVRDMIFVGANTQKVLERMNIHTIGDLAGTDALLLEKMLGKTGEMLYRYVNAMDQSPVRSIYEEKEIKSVGNSITFSENLVGENEIRHGVILLSDTVAARLRKHKLKCNTVQVVIKNIELKTISRQRPVDTPTNLAKEISRCAMDIIRAAWNMNQPIRMLSVTGMNLLREEDAVEQLDFFSKGDRKKQECLEMTMDELRKKFGTGVLGFGIDKK
jgi:DNA polymerase-4